MTLNSDAPDRRGPRPHLDGDPGPAPEVPEVVLAFGAGTGGTAPGTLLLGHFAGDRWQHADGGRLPEMFIAGEGLARGTQEVLHTELHEAAPRAGRRAGHPGHQPAEPLPQRPVPGIAEELGLAVVHVGSGFGWAATTVTDETGRAYAAEVAAAGPLGAAPLVWEDQRSG